jgi:hypothetical protein
MKKILYILTFIFLAQFNSFAQDDQGNGAARVREKMVEYIQDRLGLSKPEAERFQPVFLDYFKDLRRTNQDFKGDRLVLQQKIIELRLRYRDQFKPIIGEKRSNDVFLYERDFVNKVKEIREERLENKRDGRANKRGIGL